MGARILGFQRLHHVGIVCNDAGIVVVDAKRSAHSTQHIQECVVFGDGNFGGDFAAVERGGIVLADLIVLLQQGDALVRGQKLFCLGEPKRVIGGADGHVQGIDDGAGARHRAVGDQNSGIGRGRDRDIGNRNRANRAQKQQAQQICKDFRLVQSHPLTPQNRDKFTIVF